VDQIIQVVTVFALPVIFAITLHEAAHGYVARHFGDSTAYLAGRVSLNPLRHIDPVGTVLLPLGMLALSLVSGNGPFMFGWAKPVPVNFGNLRNPKREMLWVAIAGPGMNLLMALAWAAFAKIQMVLGLDEVFFRAMAIAGIQINISFMLLNLLPILPLDGGRVLVSLLPSRLAWKYSKLEPYGMIILLLLIMTGVLSLLLLPGLVLMKNLIATIFGI